MASKVILVGIMLACIIQTLHCSPYNGYKKPEPGNISPVNPPVPTPGSPPVPNPGLTPGTGLNTGNPGSGTEMVSGLVATLLRLIRGLIEILIELLRIVGLALNGGDPAIPPTNNGGGNIGAGNIGGGNTGGGNTGMGNIGMGNTGAGNTGDLTGVGLDDLVIDAFVTLGLLPF